MPDISNPYMRDLMKGVNEAGKQKPAQPAEPPAPEAKPSEPPAQQTAPAPAAPAVPSAPKIGTKARLDADAGIEHETLDEQVARIRSGVQPNDGADPLQSLKKVKVMLPEGLAIMAQRQAPGAPNRNIAIAAVLAMYLTADGAQPVLPDDVTKFMENFHFEGGLSAVAEALMGLQREVRMANKRLLEVMQRNIELEQLVSWLVLERKDMLETFGARNAPISTMDFQNAVITDVMRQTEVYARQRIKQEREALGRQIDRNRPSRTD